MISYAELSLVFDVENPTTLEYFELCSKHTDEPKYFERHHILPKSIFPQYAKEKWNIVRLRYKDHYTAHMLLTHIFVNHLDNHKANTALWFMSQRTDLGITPEQYDAVRSKYKDEHVVTDEYRKNHSKLCTGAKNGHYGMRHADHTKSKLASDRKGNRYREKFVYHQYTTDMVLVNVYADARSVAAAGFRYINVSSVCNGYANTHKGFVWKKVLKSEITIDNVQYTL